MVMPKVKKVEEKNEDESTKKRTRHSYLYAVGRRKKSVARVRLYKKGEGKLTVNGKDSDLYFTNFELRQIVKQPLVAVGKEKEFDISIKASGGGMRGQSEASRHGIARVLVLFDKDLRKIIKPYGYLTRDPRRSERKKPGLRGARRAPQWAKR